MAWVTEVNKWESARLKAFKLLSHLPLSIVKRAPAPAAEAVPLPSLPAALAEESAASLALEESSQLSESSSDGIPAEAEEDQLLDEALPHMPGTPGSAAESPLQEPEMSES